VAPEGPGGQRLQGFVCAPTFEEILATELRGLGSLGPRWPALLTVRAEPPRGLDPAFCLQPLWDVARVQGRSVSELGRAAVDHLLPELDGGEGPLVLHAYLPDPRAYASLRGRSQLVAQAFLERLGRVARRVRRRLHFPAEPLTSQPGPLAENARLIQLVLVGQGSLLVSAARPRRLPSGFMDLAPFAGGRPQVATDRAAPSRAYRKLLEAWAFLDESPQPGQTCVDLGGSPGGWAHTALKRGAKVVAVDRAPLSATLLRHPRLAMVVADAFGYRPPRPVDWLLCDVICTPQRTVDLVGRWMREGWCRRVVATIKFKGRTGYDVLAEAARKLATPGWHPPRIKHLPAHQNEVAILARRKSGD